MTKDERTEHCRRIASKGGRATAQKHPELMAENGRKAFAALTERLGDRGQAVAWLQKFKGMPKGAHNPPQWEPMPDGLPCGTIRHAEGD